MESAQTPIPELTEEIITRLREIVGPDAVVLSTELLRDEEWPLRDQMWIPGDETHTPSVAVSPTTVEQIQSLLRVANDTGLPVWTHSQGRNNAYGGASTRLAGSISISLRRMNRILEINEDLAYAVVEPGVRWVDLDEALRRRGSRLALSVPDIGWGSIIGNSLDNGATYLSTGVDFGAPCGLEIVLADGQLLRTGMGAMPDNPAWHTYKRGVGPGLDSLFMQSNLGIVTRMGVWLTPRPEVYIPLILTAPRQEDIDIVIDVLRDLRLRGILVDAPGIFGEQTALDHFSLEDAPLSAILRSGAQPTDDDLAGFRERQGLGAWNVRTAVYAQSDAAAEAALETIRGAWSVIAGSRVRVEGRYRPHEYDQLTTVSSQVSAGIPTVELRGSWPIGLGHINISPVVPMEGHRVRRIFERGAAFLQSQDAVRGGIGAVFVMGARTAVIVFAIVFDATNEAESRRAYEVGGQLLDLCADEGYSEYRTHITYMDRLASKLSYNNHAYQRFCETLKDAVDPNGVLSPGRYGIWGSRFRSEPRTPDARRVDQQLIRMPDGV